MDNLYQEELMEIYRHPMHKGHMDDPSLTLSKNNPMCGDKITLQLKIDNGIIKDAKFDGDACAVSVISSALVTDHIIGKSLEEAQKLTKEDLLEMIGMNLTTSRVKCATLVLNALHDVLEGFAN